MTIRLLFITLSLLLAGTALAQQPTPDPGGLGGELRLTLSEAQAMALENNLGLDIARARPLVAGEQVGVAEGLFDPAAYAEYAYDHQETPVASSVQNAFGGLQPITVIKENYWRYSGGIDGALPFGLQYNTRYELQRLDSSSSFTALSPEYRPTWRSELTLPLLRGLVFNPGNVALKRSEIDRDISDQDFRQALMNVVLLVESAYWELAAARAQDGVAQKSLQTARDLLEQTSVQYEVGVVSKVNVTEAEAGVAEREFTAIQNSNRAKRAQDVLLDVIAVPTLVEYRLTEVVLEEPAYIEYDVDEEESIRLAKQLRPELVAARKRVEDSEIQLAAARNDALPRLDVTASYGFAGIAGSEKPNPLTGLPPGLGLPKNRWSASNDWLNASGDHSYGLGARASIPIGNRTARSRVTQREIELRRAQRGLKRVEQEILLEVRNAARAVVDAREGLEAAERRRVAADETLRAEEERLRLGDSTPFNVLQREEDVTGAESQQIGALQLYRVAIATLQREEGSILRKRDISAQEVLGR